MFSNVVSRLYFFLLLQNHLLKNFRVNIRINSHAMLIDEESSDRLEFR